MIVGATHTCAGGRKDTAKMIEMCTRRLTAGDSDQARAMFAMMAVFEEDCHT